MKWIGVTFVTGLIAGILIAPDKGRNTRRKIRSAIMWLPRKADEVFVEATEKIEKGAEALDQKLEQLVAAPDASVE